MIKQAVAMLILGSAFASGMAAALPIDQEQSNTQTLQSGVNNMSGKLQSFQPAVANVAGGGFHFGRLFELSPGVITPVDVTIALWNDLPDVGSQIASGTAQLSSIGWLDVFWAPVSVTPGATYYLAATANQVPVTAAVEPAVSSDNPLASYANGRPYNFNPSTLVIDYIGDFWRTFDYSFRTYYEPTTTDVPEPGTLALLGLGLAGLGLSRRRNVS